MGRSGLSRNIGIEACQAVYCTHTAPGSPNRLTPQHIMHTNTYLAYIKGACAMGRFYLASALMIACHTVLYCTIRGDHRSSLYFFICVCVSFVNVCLHVSVFARLYIFISLCTCLSLSLCLCMCLCRSHSVSIFVCLSVSGNTSKTCTVSSVTRSPPQSPRDHHSQPLVRRSTVSPELVDVATSTGHVQYCTVCSLYAFVLLIALCFC